MSCLLCVWSQRTQLGELDAALRSADQLAGGTCVSEKGTEKALERISFHV